MRTSKKQRPRLDFVLGTLERPMLMETRCCKVLFPYDYIFKKRAKTENGYTRSGFSQKRLHSKTK